MKRFPVLVAFLVALVTLATSMPASAADARDAFRASLHVQLGPGACAGTTIIDVHQGVRNDADSGVGGNYWANDHYLRHIKVKQTAPGAFCATVQYRGGFVTYAGKSPNNTGTVVAGIRGKMFGGYRTTFTGTLRAQPAWPTHGFVGTTDYRCTPAGDCPGRISWSDQYFAPHSDLPFLWWGWEYDTRHNGWWINKIDGNVGDITSPPGS